MIYISTGGVADRCGADTATDFVENGIDVIELSGGAYSPTQERSLRALAERSSLQVHNYFPPPQEPFVFNLASSDVTVARKSLEHVRSAMRLGVELGNPVYSFHAGFRIDPSVAELGHVMRTHRLRERADALADFGDRVLLLAQEAAREGVTLLVENNVVSAANMGTYGQDPFLLTQPDEIAWFMKSMTAEVGLLLDVAHLKVSATTHGYDVVRAHEDVRSWIRAYHLSDNDGVTDSNGPVHPGSWFWGVIDPSVESYTLEVYNCTTDELIAQRNYVAARLLNPTPIAEVAI